MSEGSNQGQQQGRFVIQKVYVKDLSFETPNSPQVFTEKWEPEVNLQLSNTATAVSEQVHEVVLTLTATAKLKDKTAYLVEVQQAGIFTIEGYDKENIAALVGSYCPNILFPFAREAVSDLVAKGGFPQLLLAPINFEALYRQHLEQMQQGGQEPEVKH